MISDELKRLADDLGMPLADLERAQTAGVFNGGEIEAAQAIARWLDDPVAFVGEVFAPKVIDDWQADALLACVQDPRVAMKACKGPGKSCVLAWFLWWGIALHPHGNQVALSITADNLRDNLWKELAVWYGRSPWLQREFAMSGERVYHRGDKDTWWISARSFAQDARPDQQANTLAGLHSQVYVAIVCDESSDYPEGVLSAAEGIFANTGIEAHLVQSGNPTRCEGPLYNACTRDRHRWRVIEITGDPDDPKRSPRIDIEYAREAIASWGRDNPWVMTNILGLFPPVGSDKLLGPNDISAAEARTITDDAEFRSEPVIWGLDVARFGKDKSHLRKRQGPILWRGVDYRNLAGDQLAERVSVVLLRNMREDGNRRPDALVVDVTGVGSSAVDHLRLLGWGDILIPVDFGAAAQDPARYANKRAELWDRMATWVRKRGCLPSGSNQLGKDLTSPRFAFRLVGKRTVFILESKEDMGKRGLPSPDEADAVALTFEVPALTRRDRPVSAAAQASGHCVTEYDPFDERRA